MGTCANNKIALDKGFKTAKNIMRGHIYDILMSDHMLT